MGLAIDTAYQNLYTATRLNSQYNVQRNNQSLMNMMGNSQPLSPDRALKREKQLTFGNITNWLMAKYAEMADQSLEKQKKKDIEKSFNTFA